MLRWIDPQPISIPPDLNDAVGGHPLVAETLARRGILSAQAARAFLDPSLYTPAPPTDLPDLELAADRVQRAIRRHERIAIWGDFDADGQTATALLLEMLRRSGAEALFHIPTRNEGHGLHLQGVEHLIRNGARLILTCDTGISAHAAVARATELGAEVIITDHHIPRTDPQTGSEGYLPPALAVLNPHRLPPGHPMQYLSGVGVAYELARAIDPDLADRALDLVALGTIADVTPLTQDTRYLVQRGLPALRATTRPGLLAVYQASDLYPQGITEEHVSFVLAPRFNALGRLADAASGVELLTTEDPTRARILAAEMEGLNAQRQWLTKQVTEAALAQIEREPSLLTDHPVLVLSHPTWPGSIVGIVAGRLAEWFGKPTLLIAAPEGELARGSGRSVPGVDLLASLTDCAHLLEDFGGHVGAVGCSLRPERIAELRTALSRAIATRYGPLPEPTLRIDAYVSLSDLTPPLLDQINRLAPFGPGNPPLTLAVQDLRVLSVATVGRTGEHRRVTVQDINEQTQTVFWWHGADRPLPETRFDLAFTVRSSNYQGMAEMQIEWIDARPKEVTTIEQPPAPTVTVHDLRTVPDPQRILTTLMAQGDLQVWAEGLVSIGVEFKARRDLIPGKRLAIWTLPPGPRELQAVLDRVQPEELFLFAHNPGTDDPRSFLNRLLGMVKFAIERKAGQLDLEAAAAATAQRTHTIQAGLEWLAARGQIRIIERMDDRWILGSGLGDANSRALEVAQSRLKALLAETAAYRDYVRTAPATALLPRAVITDR